MAKFQRTPQPHHREVTEAEMDRLVDWIAEMNRLYYEANFPRLTPPTFRYQMGPTNIKVIVVGDDGKDRSVWCFVEKASGAIMKAAGWKAPEPKRYERGNVHLPEGWAKWLTPNGPQYLN